MLLMSQFGQERTCVLSRGPPINGLIHLAYEPLSLMALPQALT